MTKGTPSDSVNTIKAQEDVRNGLIKREVQYPSWLGHKSKRGATIDHLLLLGATMDELISASGSKGVASVRGHLTHLQQEHGLIISRDRHGSYTLEVDENDFEDDVVLDPTDQDSAPRQTDLHEGPTSIGRAAGAAKAVGPSSSILESAATQHWGALLRDEHETIQMVWNHETIRQKSSPDMGNVLVLLSGPDLAVIEKALSKTKQLIDGYRTGSTNQWVPGCRWAPDQYYVYQHRDESGVFYVGKGVRDRAADHVKKALEAWKAEGGRLSSRKHQRIIGALTPEENYEASLDRYQSANILSFPIGTGRMGEMMSFLAEDVLITHLNNVFELTNETGGNNRSWGYAWLTQPYQSHTVPESWGRAANYFLRHRRLSSDAKANLTEIRATNLLAGATSVLSALASIHGAQVGSLKKRGQDVFVDLSFDKLPIRMQLLFSVKNPTVKLNLRPALNENGLPGKARTVNFERAVENILSANQSLNWSLCLKTAQDPYVKPFRDAARLNTDPPFSMHDLADRCDVVLPGSDEILSFNVSEAAEYVRSLF